jgi:acyl-coenzyme A thioesterase PaaI-like protein
MQIVELDIAKNLGIERSNYEDYLLEMPFGEHNKNHVNIMHASAIFALAEMASGEYLQVNFPEVATHCVPIVRAAKIKFRSPQTSTLFAKAELLTGTIQSINEEIHAKGKILLEIEVRIYNEQEELAFMGEFQWFVTLKD